MQGRRGRRVKLPTLVLRLLQIAYAYCCCCCSHAAIPVDTLLSFICITEPPSLRSFVYFIFCKLSLLCHGQSVVVPKQRVSAAASSFELNPGIIGLAKCLTPSTTLHSQVEAAQLAPTRRRFSHCLCRVSLSHFSFSAGLKMIN